MHKVPQARHVFDEAKQRFGQHFTTGVPLDKCVAQCVMMLLVQQSLEVSLAYVLMTLPELHDCPSSHPVIQSSSCNTISFPCREKAAALLTPSLTHLVIYSHPSHKCPHLLTPFLTPSLHPSCLLAHPSIHPAIPQPIHPPSHLIASRHKIAFSSILP